MAEKIKILDTQALLLKARLEQPSKEAPQEKREEKPVENDYWCRICKKERATMPGGVCYSDWLIYYH